MLLLPRTQAPASPVQRLAHHAHTAQAQVACFASILIVVVWVFPATGLGISLGVGARTLRVWGAFNMEKTVRKAIAEARADGGGMGWMDMACVGAVLGGLEEEFVCALAAEGQ
ncbi:hypothetical protein OF83DRAFT_666360 [Amylostereum chailletii]|nr:hypothetical protein OF83DRAFT_666360 [Amylostereum chailletii]